MQVSMLRFNLILIAGLAIMRWRGAPWLAILITAGTALPLANGLMYWKQTQHLRGAR